MSDPSAAPVLLEFPTPGVALLRLNRPQATNALSLELQALLSHYFTQLAADPDVRCILLTGGDTVFAAGGDINSMAGVGPIDIYQRHTERVWARIQHCAKPVIAAVGGSAYGGAPIKHCPKPVIGGVRLRLRRWLRAGHAGGHYCGRAQRQVLPA